MNAHTQAHPISLFRLVNEEYLPLCIFSKYWTCCWTFRRVFLLLINANQFWALVLNRDQYHWAADEIWFQLVSIPAEVFNHKVNQDLEHKSDEIIQTIQDLSCHWTSTKKFLSYFIITLRAGWIQHCWAFSLVEAECSSHHTVNTCWNCSSTKSTECSYMYAPWISFYAIKIHKNSIAFLLQFTFYLVKYHKNFIIFAAVA